MKNVAPKHEFWTQSFGIFLNYNIFWQAIIHIMLKHPENKVKECWDKFQEIREHICCTPPFQEIMHEIGLHNLSANFNEFKRVVLILKDDIEKVHGKKTKA